MKDNSVLMNTPRDSEFLKEAFKLNQSFKAENEKKKKKNTWNNLFYGGSLVCGYSYL